MMKHFSSLCVWVALVLFLRVLFSPSMSVSCFQIAQGWYCAAKGFYFQTGSRRLMHLVICFLCMCLTWSWGHGLWVFSHTKPPLISKYIWYVTLITDRSTSDPSHYSGNDILVILSTFKCLLQFKYSMIFTFSIVTKNGLIIMKN